LEFGVMARQWRAIQTALNGFYYFHKKKKRKNFKNWRDVTPQIYYHATHGKVCSVICINIASRRIRANSAFP